MYRTVRILTALVPLAALCAALTGCFYPAYQAFESPTTVAPLRFELGPEVGGTAGYVVDSSNYGGSNEYDPRIGSTDLIGLDFGVLARLGVIRNLDVGVRLGPGLIGMADVKYRFLTWPVNAAVGLGFSFYPRTGQPYSTSVDGGMAFYPVLVAGSERLFGGARAVVLHEVEDEPGQWRLHPGAYVGASLGTRMKVEPEIDLFVIDQPGPLRVGYRRLVCAGAGLALLFGI